MRYLIFTFFALFSTMPITAQNTAIPDPAFEQKLINGGLDTVLDGQVLTANIDTITFLNVDSSNITDLTGIEDFIGLITLRCRNNMISTLDLLNLTSLEDLEASNNMLTSLVLPDTVIEVKASNNQLTTIDLTTHANLEELDLSNNLFTTFDSGAASLLDLDLSDNQLNTLDYVALSSLEQLDVANNLFTTLNLAPLVQLENLEVSGNMLTGLDVSTNLNLSVLRASSCNLNNIDLINNPNLRLLSIGNNNLTSLNVTANLQLADLAVNNNLLPSLDLQLNVMLDRLFISDNPMTTISLGNKPALTNFRADDCDLLAVDFTQSPILDFVAMETNQLTTVDFSQNPLLTWSWIRGNNLVSMDYSNNPIMRSINLSTNQLTSFISPPATTTLTYIALGGNQLDDVAILNSLLTFPNLNIVDLGNNQFSGTVPDLTGLPNLGYYIFSGNEFQFGDFELQHAFYRDNITPTAFYRNDPQEKVDLVETRNVNTGTNVTFTTTVSGSQNHYEWFKDGTAIAGAPDSPAYIINNVQTADAGIYTCEIKSDIVVSPNNGQELILERNDITLNVNDVFPPCTTIISPADAAVDVAIDSDIDWNAVATATGYFISIGTAPGATDVLNNFDNGNATTYNPPVDFLEGTTYYVTITPYNTAGNATGCTETSFTTETLTVIPPCTTVISPADAAVDVAIDSDIDWNAVATATGYFISIGTAPGATDVLNNFDNGNATTYNPPADFMEGATYYVTITPYNTAGNATGCTETSFTTEVLTVIPPCTTIISPADAAVDVAIDSDIDWNAVATATGYFISIGTAPGATDVLNNFDNGNATTYNPSADFLEGTTYYVTITPYNAAGNATGCVETSFTTEVVITIPRCTTLSNPDDGDVNVPVTALLIWNGVPEATGYKLTVATTTGGNDILNNLDVGAATNYNLPTNLLQGTIIYVLIIPYNSAGDAIACNEESFITEFPTTLPPCTTVISPADAAVDVAIDSDIDWNAVATATGYFISIGTAPGATDVLNNFDNGNATTYNPPVDFLEGTTYYVTITPYNTAGNATGCTETSFTTETLIVIPLCTTIILPADAAVDVAIDSDIDWNSVATATGYFISIGTAPGATDVLNNFDNGNATTYNPPADFLEGTTYYVTITPYNTAGNATGCTETSFTTEILIVIPPCTTIISPADAAVDVAIDSDIDWNAVATATGYFISIGTAPGATDVLNNFDNGNATTYNPPADFLEGTTYYVTITPYNTAGNATGCTETSFTTETLNVIPLCTTVISPANAAVDVAIDSDIDWNAVATATGYFISIGTAPGATDVLNNFDNGNSTTYNPPVDFLEGTTYYVTITPYNTAGNATGCTETSFTTGFLDLIIPKYFTPNQDNFHDIWLVEDPTNKIKSITIFDRYGKLLKFLGQTPYIWDGTFANQILPSSDYWYNITLNDGKVIRGHFTLKR